MTTTSQNTSETFTVHAPQGPHRCSQMVLPARLPPVRGWLGAAAGLSPPSVLQTPSERQVDSGNCSGPHSCRECWGDAEKGGKQGRHMGECHLPPTSHVVLGKPLQFCFLSRKAARQPPSQTARWDTRGLTEGLAKSRNSKNKTNSRHLEWKQLLHYPVNASV